MLSIFLRLAKYDTKQKCSFDESKCLQYLVCVIMHHVSNMTDAVLAVSGIC